MMLEMDRRLWAAAAVVLLIVFGLGTVYGSYRERQKAATEMTLIETDPLTVESQTDEEPPGEIVVFVSGEVEKPGIYKFSSGARVYEALDKAVPRDTADLRYVDMARIMVDEETILVPVLGEEPQPAGAQPRSTGITAQGKVNINRASAAELDAHLNGIGPTLAQRIVDYREKNGPFRKVEDLQNVSGIGEKRFADIRDRIDIK